VCQSARSIKGYVHAPVLTTIPCFNGIKLISVPEQQNANALNFNFLSGSCEADTASSSVRLIKMIKTNAPQGMRVVVQP